MLCVGRKTRPFGHPVTENAFIVLISKQDTVNQIKTDQAFSPRLLSSLNTLTNKANTSWNPSWSMRDLHLLKQACVWATESLAYSATARIRLLSQSRCKWSKALLIHGLNIGLGWYNYRWTAPERTRLMPHLDHIWRWSRWGYLPILYTVFRQTCPWTH